MVGKREFPLNSFVLKKYSLSLHQNVQRQATVLPQSIEMLMEQNVGLNQAQMDFLRLLSHFTTEEEVRELNDLVCKYYARKIDEEMDRLWDEGKWSHEKIEETLQEHLRTPYHA